MFCKKRCYRENQIKNINIQEFKEKIKQGAIILDVRNTKEYKEGHIINSINIPLYNINPNIYSIIPKKEQLILIYCQTGERGAEAYIRLQNMGYNNLYNLYGGLDNVEKINLI